MKDEFITHGYLTLSNSGGLEIQINNDGDYARLRYYDKVSRWQRIKSRANGKYYVTYYGRVYPLDWFIRYGFGCTYGKY